MKRALAYISLLAIPVIGIVLGSIGDPDPMSYDRGTPLANPQYGWQLIRTVTSADTEADANALNWDTINSTWSRFPVKWQRVEVMFLAYGDGTGDGDPNGGDFDFKLHAVRPYGSAKTIYEGYATVGELEATCAPDTGTQYNSGSLDPNESYKFADYVEPNDVGSDWIGNVDWSGVSANNQLAIGTWKTWGWRGFWPEITQMSGITSISIYVSGSTKD